MLLEELFLVLENLVGVACVLGKLPLSGTLVLACFHLEPVSLTYSLCVF